MVLCCYYTMEECLYIRMEEDDGINQSKMPQCYLFYFPFENPKAA